MYLREFFNDAPLMENQTTVGLVVDNIKHVVRDLRSVWLTKKVSGKQTRVWFAAVVSDQTFDLEKSKEAVQRIAENIKGIELHIDVVIESAFKPDHAIKLFQRTITEEASGTLVAVTADDTRVLAWCRRNDCNPAKNFAVLRYDRNGVAQVWSWHTSLVLANRAIANTANNKPVR